MSPDASAERTSDSGTCVPRLTRMTNGFGASSDLLPTSTVSGMAAASMECAIDHLHLLLPREPHEVHGVARHPDGEVRVFLRMVHGVEQRLTVQHVDVHVISRRAEERVEHRGEVRDAIFSDPP